MKLIIDIPEDVYKRTKFYKEFRDLNDCVTTIKALENGTPLDEVITDRVEYGADGNAYRLTISNGKELEQEPCDDAISRDMALEKMADYVASGYADSAEDFEEYSRIICQLPLVKPQYTDAEIQKMQELEQAEIQKAYELGKAETGWIPVGERLPEEKINPITQDYYEYQCTYKSDNVCDVRHYKFGRGHWWHGPGIMDEHVIAWMPLPEPYEPQERSE